MQAIRAAVLLICVGLIAILALRDGRAGAQQADGRDGAGHEDEALPRVLAGGTHALDPEAVLASLAARRIVFIGETHDRYDHHLNQLAIIRRLHDIDPRIAIGLEMFQQPFQPYLDAYVDGSLDEGGLLEKTQYFERWGFDYRLYRPIIAYAREQGLPLIALNVPTEISRKVGRSGLASLTAEERAWVPERIDPPDAAYRERLAAVFREHPGGMGDFERFLRVQLLWDEAMAARAARYLEQHPASRLVVLAGSGHLAHGSGIPDRLARRVRVDSAILLQGPQESRAGDFLLLSEPVALPPAGRLGIKLGGASSRAGLRVAGFAPDSAARDAGMRPDDRVIALDDRPLRGLADLRLALLDRRPGERVRLTVQGSAGTAPQRVLQVTLQ